jgi:histidyl-tRNA synthetase
MAKRIEPRLVKGMRDQVGGPVLRRNALVETARRVFERFGFQPLETPVLEYEDTLTGASAGETGKRIYHWHMDEDDVDLGLRFDLTVPLSRFVAANPQLRLPFKRYQAGPVFRVDKPGAGRFREFWQLDIDVVGTSSMLADAEILAAMGAVLRDLGLPRYTLRWNHRGILNAALRRATIPDSAAIGVIRVIDKEDKIGPDAVRAELGAGRVDEESGAPIPGLGLPAAQIDGVVDFLDLAADTDDDLVRRVHEMLAGVKGAETALREVDELRRFLAALGEDGDRVRFAPRLARGMDYYTGPIFEATLDDLPSYGSILGGGRYDQLVARFSRAPLPATGASIGVDRLLAALEALREEAAAGASGAAGAFGGTVTEVLVTTMDRKLLGAYLDLVAELRAAGLCAEVFLKPKARLGDQLRYASDWGIPYAVIMGEDEMRAGSVTVKDLEAGKEASAGVTDRDAWVMERPGQFEIARDAVVGKLVELCARRRGS